MPWRRWVGSTRRNSWNLPGGAGAWWKMSAYPTGVGVEAVSEAWSTATRVRRVWVGLGVRWLRMPSSVARGKPYSRMSWARRAVSASWSTERKDTPRPVLGRFRRGGFTPARPYPSVHRLQARLGGYPHQRSLVT